MKLASVLAVGFVLYATPNHSQTQQELTLPAPRKQTAPTIVQPSVPLDDGPSIPTPSLHQCMLQKIGAPNDTDIGCLDRINTYCQTHDTGDEDDKPSNSGYHHLLSACINVGSPCIAAFKHLCDRPPAKNAADN